MIKLFTILKKIVKESRESDAMLERPAFLRKFLNSVVDGRYGDSTLTYKDVYNFMEQAEGDMVMGDYELIDRLNELYQIIKSMASDEALQELENLVKNKF